MRVNVRLSQLQSNLETIISQSDLMPIYNEVINEQINYLSILTPELQTIYNFCIFYEKLLNEIDSHRTVTNKIRGSKNKEKYKNLQLFGAKFLFNLRTFLTNETIEFLVGAVDTEGRVHKEQYTQDKIINTAGSLRASLSTEAIVLHSSLENIKNLSVWDNESLADMWIKILQYGTNDTFNWEKSPEEKVIDTYNKQKERFIYKNTQKDNLVYIGYAGPQPSPNKIYYYNKNGGFYYYNRGWLYEWYNALMDNDNALNNLSNSIDKGSIEPLIGKVDRVKGLKGGDIQINGQQIQVKYGNKQIITFANIKKTINSIKTIIQSYINSIQTAPEKQNELVQSLANEFITLEKGLNSSANKKIQDMFKILGFS